jgi:subtilisin-like proprotein convertase family protein
LLKVVDRWAGDNGILKSWSIKLRVKENVVRRSAAPGVHIPDDDPGGITSVISIADPGQVKDLRVSLDISHTYIGDLLVKLRSPSDKEVVIHNMMGGTTDNLQTEYSMSSHPRLAELLGEGISGDWKLDVSDNYGIDIGKLNRWELEIRY